MTTSSQEGVTRRKRRALLVVAGCVVVLAACMVFAVVINAREARDFADHGVRVTARVVDKYKRTKRVGRTDQTDHCMLVEFTTADGKPASGGDCNRGIDQVFDELEIGGPVRIVYMPDYPSHVMLEDWADRKLTSF